MYVIYVVVFGCTIIERSCSWTCICMCICICIWSVPCCVLVDCIMAYHVTSRVLRRTSVWSGLAGVRTSQALSEFLTSPRSRGTARLVSIPCNRFKWLSYEGCWHAQALRNGVGNLLSAVSSAGAKFCSTSRGGPEQTLCHTHARVSVLCTDDLALAMGAPALEDDAISLPRRPRASAHVPEKMCEHAHCFPAPRLAELTDASLAKTCAKEWVAHLADTRAQFNFFSNRYPWIGTTSWDTSSGFPTQWGHCGQSTH